MMAPISAALSGLALDLGAHRVEAVRAGRGRDRDQRADGSRETTERRLGEAELIGADQMRHRP